MEFVPQLKKGRYVGFVPLSPLRVNRTPNWEHTVMDERNRPMMAEIVNIMETAGRLNWVIGEWKDRYRVRFEDPDDERLAQEIIEGVTLHQRLTYPKGNFYLEGPWQQLYPALSVWDHNEFNDAAGIIRSGWPLHLNPELTRRLEELIGQQNK